MLPMLAFSTAFLVDEALTTLRSPLAVEALDCRAVLSSIMRKSLPFPEWPERQALRELLDALRSISRSF
jgi:hypothetical protein